MGRQKLGDFIRKCDFLHAKEDDQLGDDEQNLGNQIQDKENEVEDDVNVAEIKDVYKAFQEKVCVRNFGYRHSPAYWGAYTVTCSIERLIRNQDDESDSALLEWGRLNVDTWLALLKAGPNSAHVDLMSQFQDDNAEKYLQSCPKAEIVKIFQAMKIKFSFDTKDTDLNEQSYASFLNDQITGVFKNMGGEQLKLAQEELLDLYLHYLKQMPTLSEELTCYVGYTVRDMSDPLEFELTSGSTTHNPYLTLKNVALMKTHIAALHQMLMEFNGDIYDQRFEETLQYIIEAAINDNLIEQLFEPLMDLCVKFAQRENPPVKSSLILDVFRLRLFRHLKEAMAPTPARLDLSLKSAKDLVKVATGKQQLDKDLLGLIDEIVDEGIVVHAKMTTEQVKSVLEFVTLLLASGHEKLVKLAESTIREDNIEKLLVWKKYMDEVKVLFKTVSGQPIDKMWPEHKRNDHERVIDQYESFMDDLLGKLKDVKAMPKLTRELHAYIFECLEDSPPAKGQMAYRAAGDNYFNIKKSEPPEFIEETLARIDKLLKNEDITWDNGMNSAVSDLLIACTKSYDGNGRSVTPNQRKLFLTVFGTCLAGDDIDDTFYPPGQEKDGGVKYWIYRAPVITYIAVHTETATLDCCVPLIPDILKWFKIAEEEENEDIAKASLNAMRTFSAKPPKEIATSMKEIMDIFVNPKYLTDLVSLVNGLYPHNPGAVHDRLDELKDMYDNLKEIDKNMVIQTFSMVAMAHPEAITEDHVKFLFQQCQGAAYENQTQYLHILYSISKRHPQKLQTHFPTLLDNKMFSEKTFTLRALIITSAAGRNEQCGQQAIDFFVKFTTNKDSTIASHALGQLAYLVKDHKDYINNNYQCGQQAVDFFVKFTTNKDSTIASHALGQLAYLVKDHKDYINNNYVFMFFFEDGLQQCGQQAIDFFVKFTTNKDSTIASHALGQLAYLVKDHKDYMQQHKPALQKIEKTSTVPEVRQSSANIVQVLEGKNYEDVFEDLYKEIQEQQEITAELDAKLDHTMNTVITMGDHVTQHHKDLIDVKHDLGDLEEKVEDIDEDLGQTKIKVEEIDNKTMTNAPKWSRDLTKIMNPKHDCDWRMLASRLGYSNDDIRAWAQQHDPCMAVLSEWYATHKTSEANHAVLTHLTEMNRLDGAAIVENAMKASEGVVEDEEFEYPSPPPIFLSYQWGMQNEVKLLKQHLNMAGYECWMDIGQMGGGDKLFAKIDNGIRAAKVIICCVTDKYSQSPNCNREVNLSVNLGKPMIPLLMEKMNWPPKGAMGPIFSEYLFIRFFQRGGEETKDNRYWPVPKFEELLMQLNYSVPPDESMITKEYNKWWVPIVEDIVIDKNKGKSGTVAQSSSGQSESSDESPLVFLSYQWGKQPQVKALYQRICSLGYTVWMDIFQMGGGDSLYDKIDRGVRGCKVVVTCVTPKYALSANCRREVSLADALKKPIVPLLLEQMKWPPDGPMSMVFTELLYIQVYRDPDIQVRWTGEKFDELAMKLQQYVGGVPEVTAASQEKPASGQSKAKPESAPQKGKPGGSSAQHKFVEPKDKVEKAPASKGKAPPSREAKDPAKPPANKGKPQSSTSQRSQKPPTPKEDQAKAAKQQSDPKENKPSSPANPQPTRKVNTEKPDQKNKPAPDHKDPEPEKPKSKSCAIL